MGRIEKLKRQAINEANIRILGEGEKDSKGEYTDTRVSDDKLEASELKKLSSSSYLKFPITNCNEGQRWADNADRVAQKRENTHVAVRMYDLLLRNTKEMCQQNNQWEKWKSDRDDFHFRIERDEMRK